MTQVTPDSQHLANKDIPKCRTIQRHAYHTLTQVFRSVYMQSLEKNHQGMAKNPTWMSVSHGVSTSFNIGSVKHHFPWKVSQWTGPLPVHHASTQGTRPTSWKWQKTQPQVANITSIHCQCTTYIYVHSKIIKLIVLSCFTSKRDDELVHSSV